MIAAHRGLPAQKAPRTFAGVSAVSSWCSGFAHLLPRAAGLSGLTILGQLSFLIALPLLSRLYSPSALGLFTLYLSVVNIGGPIVGLKYESALYAQADHGERCVLLRLSITVIATMSVIGSLFLAFVASRLEGNLGPTVQSLILVLPLGLFLSGMWNTSTAWAVREDALRTLSIARFLQPSSMTVLQVVFGLCGRPAIFLVFAHLASHLIYSGFILRRSVSPGDVRCMANCGAKRVLTRALRDYRFAIYVMPAYLMTVLINNAPPLLMGALFGTDLAGHYGVAYRVVTSPLTVICMPLSNLFTSEASQARDPQRLRTITRFVVTFSIGAVAIPVAMFGLVAPQVTAVLLGSRWMLAGQIMAALALMGAAQAIAAPLNEVPSIYLRQGVRLTVDLVQSALFFMPLAVGYKMGWDALEIIRFMAIGGAVGYLLSAAASLIILRKAAAGVEV